jgi:hypothetical protein
MTHLSPVIAAEKKKKEKVAQELAKAQGVLGQASNLAGISRTYRPKIDGGDQYPPESTRVRNKVKPVLKDVQTALVELFDVIATKDWTNCVAKADVVVDGKPLIKGAPTTYLLFLEKQLAEILSFVKKIPTLDAAEDWHHDDSQDCYATEPTETVRTKKIPRNHVRAEATDKHPAQVDLYMEDVPEGYWKTIKYSGAIPAKELNEVTERIEKLQHAVLFAREEANKTEVIDQRPGKSVLAYIFPN